MKKWNLNALSAGRRGIDALPPVNQSGFSIIELMMSLVLLAIGAALSIPSYRAMVEKRQLTHGGEQILAFVNAAQGEAMKRNQVVTVSYDRDDDDDWCVGMVVGAAECDCRETDTSADDYCAIDSVPRIISNSNVGDTELVSRMRGAYGEYSFDPIRGIFLDPNDSLLVAMHSLSGDYLLDLRVNNTGQAILCSRDQDHAVPGYKVCPAYVDSHTDEY
jgi:prepilin-type N-terminal cleavage/methylation domain-containing protein